MENTLLTEIMVLREKNTDLVYWKESASIILDNINLQAIGSELNLKLGSDISSQVLPEIIKIKQRNIDLVKMFRKVIEINKIHGFNGHCINNQIESLIYSNKLDNE